jgi:hypothetical protein
MEMSGNRASLDIMEKTLVLVRNQTLCLGCLIHSLVTIPSEASQIPQGSKCTSKYLGRLTWASFFEQYINFSPVAKCLFLYSHPSFPNVNKIVSPTNNRLYRHCCKTLHVLVLLDQVFVCT